MINLRGGWRINGNLDRNFFSFEPERYAGIEVPTIEGALEPYAPSHRIDNLFNGSVTLGFPSRRSFDASVTYTAGEVAVFAEGSEGGPSGSMPASGIVRHRGSAWRPWPRSSG